MPTERLRRLQRLFGLLPLILIAVLHLWEHSPIREGRSGVLERLYARFEGLPFWLEGVLLLGALGVQVGVGIVLHRRAPSAAAEEPAGIHRRNASVAGLVALGFVLWHLSSLWVPARVLGEGPLLAMARAEAQLDSLVGALAYVLGWSGFVVVLAYGLFGRGVAAADGGRAGGGGEALVAFVAGLALWLWGLDLLTAYVAGASLF